MRGHVAELLLAVMAGEAVWLTVYHGWDARAAALRLLPGACLALALRGALVGAAWWWIALWLALSLPPHLADLRRG